MEEVPGIPGSVPPLIPYPPENVRTTLPPTEWQACLDSWLLSLEFRLRLTDQHFSNFRLSQNASGIPFVLSYLQSHVRAKPTSNSGGQDKARQLYRRTYLLLKRLLLKTKTPFDYSSKELLDLISIANGVFQNTADWAPTLKATWKRDAVRFSAGVEAWKAGNMAELSSGRTPPPIVAGLHQMNALVKILPEVGLILLTGSDYLESLMTTYDTIGASSGGSSVQKSLTEHIYYCFRSLMSDGSSHPSLLLDHLYHLRSEADRIHQTHPQQITLCSNLICSTSFLRHLAADATVAHGKRGQGLLDDFNTYRQHTLHLHPPSAPRERKMSKGKGKAHAKEEMHIHKAAQISQIHDLFPRLHTGYIVKLLDHFNDNVEIVIATLLEPESLPPALQDQGQESDSFLDIGGPTHDLAPSSTPPLLPQRKNVFNDDDFDRLKVSSSKLHRGRKDLLKQEPQTADDHSRSKAAIMAALAAFDSDDDERDDTYDVADVGGTVDQSIDTDSRHRADQSRNQNPGEEVLFRAWKDAGQDMFARDSKTRVSRVRQDLKRETGMSDEQIEGWAIMLNKDSALQNRLERKYAATSTFRGNQHNLEQTRWQASASGTDSQDDGEGTASGDGRRMGQAQIRGPRNWGRGRGGGSTSGPAQDDATQAARRRKEQGRGRGGASHNRREGRARKMGRGMAGAPGQ